jgi:putative ABC transport system substrate-binding protein
MVVAADPVRQGLVASLARPGGNVTGLTTLAEETGGKGLEVLKQIVPRISRAAIVGNPTDSSYHTFLEAIESAARALGVIVQLAEVRSLQEFEPAFAKIKRERVDALVLLADQVTVRHGKLVVEFTAKNHLPAVYPITPLAEAGGLISYGFSFADQYRRAGYYVDKILKRAKPADLPIEQPTKFELVINMKTVKALGLTIPPSVLARADQVIQ